MTATATDTAGQPGSHSIAVTVGNSGGSGMSLTTTGYKVRGLQKADLEWDGATSDNVGVYRDTELSLPPPTTASTLTT